MWNTSGTEIEKDEKDIDVNLDSCLETTQAHSPSSSSSSAASKTTNDTTFEPSVDMMVNDFDDEGTLEEEEQLARQEAEDPSSELSSLEKESEMPIEELMALYNYVPHIPKKKNRKQKKRKLKEIEYTKKQHKSLTMSSAAVCINSSAIMLAATSTLQMAGNIVENNNAVTNLSSPLRGMANFITDLSPFSNKNGTELFNSNNMEPKKLIKRRISMCEGIERYNGQQQSESINIISTKRDDHVFTPPKKVPPRRSSSALLPSNSTFFKCDKPRRRLSDFADSVVLSSSDSFKNAAALTNNTFNLKDPKTPKRSSAYSSLMKPSASSSLLSNLPLSISKHRESDEIESRKHLKQKQNYFPVAYLSNNEKKLDNIKFHKNVVNDLSITTISESAEKSLRDSKDTGDEDGDNDDGDDDDDDDEDDDDDDYDTRIISSDLRHLYPETYGDKKSRRYSRNLSDDEDEVDDDYSPEEVEDIKKTIMVGSEFQALIPEGFLKYDDVLPYENEDKLLWDPNVLIEAVVESFLTSYHDLKLAQQMSGLPPNKLHSSFLNSMKIIELLPEGNHLKDDEQALLLLSQCGHSIEEALRRKCINAVPTTDTSLWSAEECRNFESGIRTFGKDFYTIKQQKVRTRAVGEIVQFYYLWKKTDRHDMFANKARLDKKKYSLKPGVTEYMDRFLEEQDNGGNCSNGVSCGLNGVRDRSVSPSNSVTGSSTKLYVGVSKTPMKLNSSNNKLLSHNISIMNNEKKNHISMKRTNSITGANKNGCSNYNYQSHLKNFNNEHLDTNEVVNGVSEVD